MRLGYPVITQPLPGIEGGGFVVIVPDLCGCISNLETAEAALASAMDAITARINEATAPGRPIPPPSRHQGISL